MPSYDSLFGAEASPVKRGTIPPEDRRRITERLKAFAASPRMKDDALALYVNAQVRQSPVSTLRQLSIHVMHSRDVALHLVMRGGDVADLDHVGSNHCSCANLIPERG